MTIFVVLGIIVIAVIGAVLYFQGGILSNNLTEEEESRLVSTQLDPVKQVIIDCTKKELIKGVRLVSIQGGYYDPVYYEDFGGFQISYACIGDVNRLPLKGFVENEINQYMQTDEARSNVEECISNFDFFRNKGLNVNHDFGDFSTDAPTITQNKIRQKITYPITISRGDSNARFDELVFDIKSNLDGVLRMATEIVGDECNGVEFNLADYFWERRQEGENPAADFDKHVGGQVYETITPSIGAEFILQSTGLEEDGEKLDFHFLVEL